ncbi:C2H2 type zinc-finger-domain-containing protein [Cladorrhinum samala]|uniref:C2H2 type zinc-finger-domain-containing protein n=1 Tax=Cladorrhinum samala TaxID=585594 RepID=A0AAV9HNK3_9PEZI|nr:C2H2 type zinc-finger-domain-containing protein [Cladorrhinum samala]
MATVAGSRSAPGADLGSSHPYTCNTCQVAFRNSDLQRGHMRSDWHRYNLKRRVASLPPISSEIFTEKVLQARAATTEQAEKAGFERACETCNKNFYSENSFRNHLSSSKHKTKAAYLASKASTVPDDASSMTFSLGEPAPTDSVVDSDAEEEFNEIVEGIKNTDIQEGGSPVKRPSNPTLSAAAQRQTEHPVSEAEEGEAATSPSTATPVATATQSTTAGPARSLQTCLFCNYESPTAALNVNHMEKIHGMFIPEKQYLVNLDGLLNHLQERVFDLNECLTCYKVKANSYAVQTHMRDKSHCQIPYTTEEEQLEIGEFYDFRSTYSDDEGDWEDEEEGEDVNGGGAKLGAQRSSKLTNEDGDEVMEEDESWETDSEASSLDSNDLHAVPAENHYHQYDRLSKHPHHSRDTPRTHHQADGWHAHSHKRNHAVFYDEYELHLPSGKSVGHRSLNKYYRQNLYNYPTPEERAERLAIEAADAENGMDVDSTDEETGNSRKMLSRRGRDPHARGRALVTRDMRGMGITAVENSKQVSAVVEKGKKKEWKNQGDRGFLQARLGIKAHAAHPATYLR